MSTYAAGDEAEQASLESEQASFYAGVEAATASLGLPAAAPFMLDDLVGGGVPWPESTQPQDWYYGLYGTDGQAKPAAAVVQELLQNRLGPLVLDPGFETGTGGVPTGGPTRVRARRTWSSAWPTRARTRSR